MLSRLVSLKAKKTYIISTTIAIHSVIWSSFTRVPNSPPQSPSRIAQRYIIAKSSRFTPESSDHESNFEGDSRRDSHLWGRVKLFCPSRRKMELPREEYRQPSHSSSDVSSEVTCPPQTYPNEQILEELKKLQFAISGILNNVDTLDGYQGHLEILNKAIRTLQLEMKELSDNKLNSSDITELEGRMNKFCVNLLKKFKEIKVETSKIGDQCTGNSKQILVCFEELLKSKEKADKAEASLSEALLALKKMAEEIKFLSGDRMATLGELDRQRRTIDAQKREICQLQSEMLKLLHRAEEDKGKMRELSSAVEKLSQQVELLSKPPLGSPKKKLNQEKDRTPPPRGSTPEIVGPDSDEGSSEDELRKLFCRK